jgi:hypothetical protein
LRRHTSSSRRRKRLRATAVDWNFGTISPSRGWPVVLSVQLNSSDRLRCRRPSERHRARSAWLTRRRGRGSRSLVVSGSRAWSPRSR